MKWETLPDAGGNIKEQGSCIIQASGKVVKFEKEKKRRSRRQSSVVSEEINYLPQGKMNVTYKFNSKYYGRNGLCAEEEASGSKPVKGKEAQKEDSSFALVALLGMAGKGTALQLCGDIDKIQEKLLRLREEPPNDNYMFLFNVPFRTTIKKYKEGCPTPSPGGKAFGLNISLKKLDERGMHGSFSWNTRASDYNQAAIRECGSTTQFDEPSPGRNYNVHYNVSWQFGKGGKVTEPAKKKNPCTILTTRLLEIDAIIKAYSDDKLFDKFDKPDGKLSDAKRADMYQEAVQNYFNELMNNKEAAGKGGSGNVKTLLTANGSTLTITYENVIVVNTDGSINLPGYNEAMNGFIADCDNRSAGISLFNAALVHEKDHIENFRQGKWGDDPQGLRDLELSAYRKEREQLLKDLEIMRKRGDCK